MCLLCCWNRGSLEQTGMPGVSGKYQTSRWGVGGQCRSQWIKITLFSRFWSGGPSKIWFQIPENRLTVSSYTNSGLFFHGTTPVSWQASLGYLHCIIFQCPELFQSRCTGGNHLRGVGFHLVEDINGYYRLVETWWKCKEGQWHGESWAAEHNPEGLWMRAGEGWNVGVRR